MVAEYITMSGNCNFRGGGAFPPEAQNENVEKSTSNLFSQFFIFCVWYSYSKDVTRDVTIYSRHVLLCVEEQPEGCHQGDLQAQGEQEQAPHRSDQVMD